MHIAHYTAFETGIISNENNLRLAPIPHIGCKDAVRDNPRIGLVPTVSYRYYLQRLLNMVLRKLL